MNEKEVNHEELEAFREEISSAIDSTIFILTSEQDAGPFTIDPFSLGLGDQILSELSPEKQNIVKEQLYNLAGISDGKYQALDTYHTGTNNEILIRIIEGITIDESGEVKSFYVHETEHPEGVFDWQISSAFNRIDNI